MEDKELTISIINSDKHVTKERFITAFFAALIASLASLCFGFAIGYTSPTEVAIENDSRLNITKDEFSWFASIIALGALFGSIFAGFSVDKFGRKTTILITSVFYIPGWCLICYATNISMLYAGRILVGVGVGITSLTVPLYIAEVSSARLRGGLGAINQFGITIGIFLSYLVGSSISWDWTAIFAIAVVAVMVILMIFMPETPRWLITHNQRQKALQNLIWLRGSLYDVEKECNEMETNLGKQENSSLKDIRRMGLFRLLLVGGFLMFFQQFCGINAVLFFNAKIFSSAGFNDSKVVSLSVGATLVLATAVSCLIVDKSGRKVLLMVGSIVMFLCNFFLAIYYDIAKIPLNVGQKTISIFGRNISHSVPLNQISWLGVLCVIVYIAIFSLGWGPLPWLLMSEIFPPRIRGFASAVVTFINWSLVFLVTKSFQYMIKSFYEQGTFFFYSLFCLLSFFFVFFFVPETKGKTLEEIQQCLKK
ncbi:solute carrier family 2, facilitated glucose transporter member 8 [Hydra vulgaris]|uniref:solute carrier family 2, facilitated glucose transporter member 8 n=1 Tax=Hydra vulgaris TaxID=6087 RepID=UPI001F5F6EE7|nr:solute carrier family 2, facilitated glucose transporter member 8-like [Hydra vulgaris]